MGIHHHHHESEHSHHAVLTDNINAIFIISIAINLLFVLVEAVVGFWQDSLGLLSDAGHNLSDVFGLVLALLAFRLVRKPRTKRFTYGYKKVTVLVSLVNAIVLFIAVGAIVLQSIYKFRQPIEINGFAISWTSGVGILVNGVTTLLLLKNSKSDLNIKGAYLHMLADTLVSVGVLVSGLVIHYTGWYFIDSVIGLVVALIILLSTWSMLVESFRLTIDATPHSVDFDHIISAMKKVSGVLDVHHIHIWALSTTEVALTAHVRIADVEGMEDVKRMLKSVLKEEGINHSTIEFETRLSECETEQFF